MLKIFAIGLLIVIAVVFSTVWVVCPCAMVPGGSLSGGEMNKMVSDWSFVNSKEDVPLCQVEVSAFLPHSVNVNCMSANRALYVSCSNCDGKYWSSKAMMNSNGRVRAGSSVYPVTLIRVVDFAELDVAWQARANKVGAREIGERPDHWWSFRLESRSGG